MKFIINWKMRNHPTNMPSNGRIDGSSPMASNECESVEDLCPNPFAGREFLPTVEAKPCPDETVDFSTISLAFGHGDANEWRFKTSSAVEFKISVGGWRHTKPRQATVAPCRRHRCASGCQRFSIPLHYLVLRLTAGWRGPCRMS